MSTISDDAVIQTKPMTTELKTREEIFTALAKGKVVEWKFSNKEGSWETYINPVGATVPGVLFRIKPEPEPSPGEVAEAMRMYGGGFMSALGSAVHHADEDNLQRIKTAFSEDWQKYVEVAKRTMKEREG